MSEIDNTDSRLVTILECGNKLKRSIDPESMLEKFSVTGLACIPAESSWTLRLEYMQMTGLRIRGALNNNNIPVIARLEYTLPTGGWKAVAIKHDSTVSRSVGNLSMLPPVLKKAMSAGITKKSKKGEPFDMEEVVDTALNALLWGIEVKDGFKAKDYFGTYKFRYTNDIEGQPIEADFAAIMNVDGGTITIRTEANVFGLKNKRVILDKHVGMQHFINAYCTVKENDVLKPSLRTALLLSKRIPDIFTGDRKKRTGIKETNTKK